MSAMFKGLFTVLALAASVPGVFAAKPNVILVMADDQGSVSYTHLTLPTILLV